MLARPARRGSVSLRVSLVVTAFLFAAAIGGCSSGGPLGEYEAARTLHLAPDGRLIVADGTVCAAIGDATLRNAGFATLRCTDGLVADLEAFQARSKLPSNPYDVVSDGGEGWYVSDGAANNILHVDRAGKVRVVARFPSLAATGLGDRDGQGVPTGMTLGPDRTLYVALYGGAPFDGPPAAVVSLTPGAATRPDQIKPKLVALLPHPIALVLTPDGLAVVDYGGAPGERGRGELRLIAGVGTDAATAPRSPQPAGPTRLLASGLDSPTGVVRLPDGRWVIAESGHPRLTVLTGNRS